MNAVQAGLERRRVRFWSTADPNLKVVTSARPTAPSRGIRPTSQVEGLELGHRRVGRAAFANDGDDLTAQSGLAKIKATDEAVHIGARSEPFKADQLCALHRVPSRTRLRDW